MTPLYAADEARRLKRRMYGFAVPAIVLGALGLAVCVSLCAQVRHDNIMRRYAAVTLVSTLTGWAVMGMMLIGYQSARAALRHYTWLQQEPPVRMTGVLSVQGGLFHIPGSIVVQKVSFSSGQQAPRLLNVRADRRRLLPGRPTPVSIECRRNFITSFEVIPHA